MQEGCRKPAGKLQKRNERLLLESNAPVLGPDKEQRNEPQNVWLSCLQSTASKSMPVEEVAHITTTNAQQLFPRAFV
jgi:TatD DNase family protein